MKLWIFFCISLSTRGFHELKPRIHASSNGDRSVCFSVKEKSEMAQVQEYRFRGSIIITTNDCIVGIVSIYSLVLIIIMLKWWWHDTWFLMMRLWMSPDFFLLKSIFCFHTWMSWKSYDSELRIDHAEFVADDFWHCWNLLYIIPTHVTSWLWIMKILVISYHIDDCLKLFWYDNSSWEEYVDAAKSLKAWLLMCLCYNCWMTLEKQDRKSVV